MGLVLRPCLSAAWLCSLPQFPLSTRGCIPPSAHHSPAGTNATFLNTSDMWADEGSGQYQRSSLRCMCCFCSHRPSVGASGTGGGERGKHGFLHSICRKSAGYGSRGSLPPPPHKKHRPCPQQPRRGDGKSRILQEIRVRRQILRLLPRGPRVLSSRLLRCFFSSSPRSALPAAAALQCVGRHTLPACRKAPGVLWGAGFSLSISYPLRAPGREADPKALSSSKGVSADRFPSSNTVHGQMRRGGCLEV